MFENLSSSVSWCETKYERSEEIVEYWNSMSSLIISAFGLYGFIFKQTNKYLYHILYIIGIGSYYFHSTLSLAGQMTDELSISLLLMLIIHKLFSKNTIFINIFCGLQLFVQMYYPFFNRFFLFLYGIPVAYKVLSHSKTHSKQVINLVCIAIFSAICWILDFVCCEAFCDLRFHPKLGQNLEIRLTWHSVWHCLIGLTGFMMIEFIDIVKSN